MTNTFIPTKFDSAFSSVDLVGQCLMDRERSEAFDRAIRSVIKPHHTVLDAGTGSGLLALFAARAGARRVIALEYDPYIAAVARANIRANGYENVIEVIEADGRNYQFDATLKFDVVIAEMLTTGCIDEFQVQAINNLHRQNVLSPKTIFIPQEQQTFVTLAQTRRNLYGLNFPMVLHQWRWQRSDCPTVQLLSERQFLRGLNFAKGGIEPDVSQKISFAINASSVANSLYLTSTSTLTSSIQLDDTLALNAPVIVPLPDRDVFISSVVQVRLTYKFGGGFKSLSAEWE